MRVFRDINLQTKLIMYIIGIILLATLPFLLIGIYWLNWTSIGETMLFGGLLLTIWVAGLLGAYWIANKVFQPIQILKEAVERFTQGDLEYQVQVEGDREIRQLLSSFNNLSVALKESLGYLNQYAADLQMELVEKQEMMEEQKTMYLNFIKSAAKAIEAKDNYTSGHSERVAKYAVMIATELELEPKTVEDIRIAAALHDIGKIGLQDAILQKPASLTREEFDLVKEHPVVGAEILAPLQMEEIVLEGIKYHHERFDGLGYPEGRNSSQLSIAPRVIGVADAFDAMTSSRPYRQALTREVAVKELLRWQGKQFDPEVVQAFIQALEREETGKKVG